MSNDENKFQPSFQILHIKSACFLLELAMALVTTIGMRFLQVCTKIRSKYQIDSIRYYIRRALLGLHICSFKSEFEKYSKNLHEVLLKAVTIPSKSSIK